jgi:hypothetical protein
MRKEKPRPANLSGDNNLIWAVVGLLICSAITAFATYGICTYVTNSFADSNAMVMLITDAGIKSDDSRLEGNLTAATQGLIELARLGLALGIGCIGVGVAVLVRIYRKPAL